MRLLLAFLALAVASAAAADEPYRIGPEDLLEISVWKEDALKKDVLVRPDGEISFPLAGDVHAAGRTVAEVREELAKRIAKYVPDPVVSVLVLRTASNRIYVVGRVAKPGDYPAGRFVDILQALAMAGGLTPYADEKDIKVIRREKDGPRVFPFNFKAVSRGESLEQNILLQGGDIVVVP